MTDLFHRIRWANVARAAALLLAVLLALAWPRLKAHDDALPPVLAEPLTPAPSGEVAEEEDGARGEAAGDEAPAQEGTSTGEEDEAPEQDDAVDDATRAADARREATRRKAAKRRVAKRAAAERAKRRRATVARRRRTEGGSTTRGAAPAAGLVPAWRPPPPVAPGAEFRP